MNARNFAAGHATIGAMSRTWSPSSWRNHPAAQQPEWPDEGALEEALRELKRLPPLVFAGESRRLKSSLARVAQGEAFVLQAGDCAESFRDLGADSIRDKLKVILQMAVVLTYASGLPVVKVGRIAGQFAKPRTNPLQERDGVSVPSFRGHAVNDDAFDPAARVPDPARMIRAYNQSASTLNLIRAFTKGGFADLRQIHTWNLGFVAASEEGRRYEEMARQVERALRFMTACGVDLLGSGSALREVDFYTSHEALLLPFEEALTRRDSLTGDPYDCSAHLLWIGERTRQVGGAHVEFLSGVKNPVAVKIGPGAGPDEVVGLCELLDPDREPGRLSLITRLGAGRVGEVLPSLIRAVKGAGWDVVWICDPMHGNTFKSTSKMKTRRFQDVLAEIRGFFGVHRQEGTVPGGVHLELTAENVTECLGGAGDILGDDVSDRHQVLCDPRLNPRQSLDLAFEIGAMLQG